MAITSQDLKKGIDITAQTKVTGSEYNQLVDAGRLADDKGMIINTKDIALNIPSVPNPDALLEGVTPIWWKRYKWTRHPFQAGDSIITYNWDEFKVPDAVYLRWVSESVDTKTLQSQVTALQAKDVDLQAQITANASSIAVNAGNIGENTEDLHKQQQQQIIANLEVLALIEAICPPGTLRVDASDLTTDGWLKCDGASYAITSYPDLYARITNKYGAIDTSHFNVPDIRGRTIVVSGQGTSLSLRTLGQVGGLETVKLTGDQSGLKAHSHTTPMKMKTGLQGFPSGDSKPVVLDTAEVNPFISTDSNTAIDAVNAHENMMPFMVFNVYIKT